MNRERTLAWAAWVTICVVWGTTYLAIRIALETVPVLLLAGLRWMSAGLVLAIISVATRRRLPGPRLWASLALLGFLMNVIGNGFVVWAEQYVASGLTAVIVATVPFWSIGIESFLRGGERIRPATLAGLLLGFLGIVVLVWPEVSIGGRQGREIVAGVVGLQIACVGWAIGTSYTKRHPVSADPLAASTVQMLFSGTMLLGLATAGGEWGRLHFTLRSLSAMAYLTLAGSALAYTAFVHAVRHLPISTVSLYAYVNPLIAVALGSLLLDEPFSARIVFASALVLAGIAMVRGVQSWRVPTAPTRVAGR
ncbi:MAG: EamA family transporter [Acidobacteriota bacterium]|nr:EamA family transporter [Acidobacteriota bacterium]